MQSTMSWKDYRLQGQQPWIPDLDSRFTMSLAGPWSSVSLLVHKMRVGISGDERSLLAPILCV